MELDPYFTRCPGCQKVFKLSPAQLERTQGRVRCGTCQSRFIADEHRVLPVQGPEDLLLDESIAAPIEQGVQFIPADADPASVEPTLIRLDELHAAPKTPAEPSVKSDNATEFDAWLSGQLPPPPEPVDLDQLDFLPPEHGSEPDADPATTFNHWLTEQLEPVTAPETSPDNLQPEPELEPETRPATFNHWLTEQLEPAAAPETSPDDLQPEPELEPDADPAPAFNHWLTEQLEPVTAPETSPDDLQLEPELEPEPRPATFNHWLSEPLESVAAPESSSAAQQTDAQPDELGIDLETDTTASPDTAQTTADSAGDATLDLSRWQARLAPVWTSSADEPQADSDWPEVSDPQPAQAAANNPTDTKPPTFDSTEEPVPASRAELDFSRHWQQSSDAGFSATEPEILSSNVDDSGWSTDSDHLPATAELEPADDTPRGKLLSADPADRNYGSFERLMAEHYQNGQSQNDPLPPPIGQLLDEHPDLPPPIGQLLDTNAADPDADLTSGFSSTAEPDDWALPPTKAQLQPSATATRILPESTSFEQLYSQSLEQSLALDDAAEPKIFAQGLLDSTEIQSTSPELPPVKAPHISRFWWWLLAMLLLALGAQGLWLNKASLSQNPSWRPLLHNLCQLAGCELPALQALDKLKTEQLEIRLLEQPVKALNVRMKLKNEADFAQAYPQLELIFTNLNDELIAKNLFTPEQYLGKNGLLAAGATVQIDFKVSHPGNDPVNFEVRLH